MEADGEPTDAARDYATAHARHYSAHDLLGALQAYDRLIARYPGAVEAGHSSAQIQNIVQQVVPADELLRTLVQLAHRHLQPDEAEQP